MTHRYYVGQFLPSADVKVLIGPFDTESQATWDALKSCASENTDGSMTVDTEFLVGQGEDEKWYWGEPKSNQQFLRR